MGVFDSGAGGLTVLSSILAANKPIQLHYFADEAFAPYGSLSVTEVQRRAIDICRFLIETGVTALVIACNTATLEAIALIRSLPVVIQNNIPVIGVEPAVKPAGLMLESGMITVLATPVTCASQRLKRLIQDNSFHNRNGQFARFHCLESSVLAKIIDTLPSSKHLLEQELLRIKQVMDHLESRVLVLACTHYPLIKNEFESLLDSGITILEPSQAISNRLFDCLDLNGMDIKHDNYHVVRLYSSGDAGSITRLECWLRELLGQSAFNRLTIKSFSSCQIS